MEGSTSPPESDDFRSVFQSAAEAERLRPRPLLSDAQLLDKLERELEALDEKRLSIQRTMKSLQEAPYSTRHSRALEQARYDGARTSRRIHRLFQQHQQMREQQREQEHDRQTASKSSFYTMPMFPLDEDRWQLLYQQYAAVTDMLNSTCIASLQLQQQLHNQSKQPQHSNTNTANNPHNRPTRRRPLSSPPTDPIHLSDDEDTHPPPLQLTVDATVQQAGSKREEFMRLQSMVADVASMFKDVRDMVAQHSPLLHATQSKLSHSHSTTHSATRHLHAAQRYSHSMQVMGLTAAGGAVGALIGGPVGALLGAKTAVVVAAGGVGLLVGGVGGGLAGTAIAQKAQRERREQALAAAAKEEEEKKQNDGESYVAHRMFSGRDAPIRAAANSAMDAASDLWCSIWPAAQRPAQPIVAAGPVMDGSINRPDPAPGSSAARVPPPAVYSSLMSPNALSSSGGGRGGKQRTAIWSRRE